MDIIYKPQQSASRGIFLKTDHAKTERRETPGGDQNLVVPVTVHREDQHWNRINVTTLPNSHSSRAFANTSRTPALRREFFVCLHKRLVVLARLVSRLPIYERNTAKWIICVNQWKSQQLEGPSLSIYSKLFQFDYNYPAHVTLSKITFKIFLII
jgi:hypothetical protein